MEKAIGDVEVVGEGEYLRSILIAWSRRQNPSQKHQGLDCR